MSRTRYRYCVGTGIMLVALVTPCISVSSAAAEPDFDRDIRPILSDKCYFCHGPDGERREADLRLDTHAGATEWAVVPGDPDASELIARITSDDDSMRMPPPESNLSLTDDEKQLLRDWIVAGAEYTEHWSFRPLPKEIAVPRVSNADWTRNEIDRFVLSKLESEGVTPTPRAAAWRLLRRLSFDLTGLPPTAEEAENFESLAAKDVDAAVAAAVSRLTSSAAFGEHLAVGWLDAARYADSFGYQADQLNTQWPYRDWVVRAFNENLPYDQFLTWQLAGDLLENPTRDQILATAFNRMHRMTSEGGSIAEEWLVENAADRVHTFGSAMLGLTLECCRCHDHKYDPISARDYYSISAFFNSIDESGMYDHTQKVPSPTLLLPNPEQERQLAVARVAVASAEEAVMRTQESSRVAFDRMQPAAKVGAENTTDHSESSKLMFPLGMALGTEEPIPDLLAHFTFDDDLSELRAVTPHQSIVAKADGLTTTAGRRGKAVRCDGDKGVVFPQLMQVDRFDSFTIDLWLRDVARSSEAVVIAQRTFGTDVGYNGFDLVLADGILEARFYRVWPGNAIGVRATQAISSGEWQHVAVTYDGSSRAAGLKLYLDGEVLSTKTLRDKIHKSASVATFGQGEFTLGERFRDRGFKDGEFDDLRLYARALSPLEIASLHKCDLANAESSSPVNREFVTADVDALSEYYSSAHDGAVREAAAALREARKRLVAIEDSIHEVSVMEELAEPRPTYVLPRGAYDSVKSDETRVQRDVFGDILPRFPSDAPRNRLGLARWVTSHDNPLTARLFVNRLWANFFGHGLSTTPDNFGRQGATPTHPELLDWLARDFIENGWDVKRLCRQIVTSAAYQQDSRTSVEMRERDPENLLLARGPSRRLSAEQIRDLSLAASDLLVNQPGGPPAYPYQPGDDLWRESNSMSPPYRQGTGRDLHRRSLYSIWKRTAPLPNMLVFDATSREVCTISRGRTNTPLQALVLLNDVQFVEAARGVATAVAETHTLPVDSISAAFLRLAGRAPDETELKLLVELYESQLAMFAADGSTATSASKLLSYGETRDGSAMPTDELAALTIVCQAILNLDATIYER